MLEILTVEGIVQLGFPIAVTCFLLFERSQFNIKISECLVKITAAMERIEQRMR